MTHLKVILLVTESEKTLIQMYIFTLSNDGGVQSTRPCGGPHFVLLLTMCAVHRSQTAFLKKWWWRIKLAKKTRFYRLLHCESSLALNMQISLGCTLINERVCAVCFESRSADSCGAAFAVKRSWSVQGSPAISETIDSVLHESRNWHEWWRLNDSRLTDINGGGWIYEHLNRDVQRQ